jgi:hypothetical protein
MLLADGNSGSFEPTINSTPVEGMPSGIGITTVASPSTIPVGIGDVSPDKVITGVISWYWIVLIVIVAGTAAWLTYKKVMKR